jgi:hypothetical protein
MPRWCREEQKYVSILNFGARWKWVMVLTGYEASWSQKPSGRRGVEKISCISRGLKTGRPTPNQSAQWLSYKTAGSLKTCMHLGLRSQDTDAKKKTLNKRKLWMEVTNFLLNVRLGGWVNCVCVMWCVLVCVVCLLHGMWCVICGMRCVVCYMCDVWRVVCVMCVWCDV